MNYDKFIDDGIGLVITMPKTLITIPLKSGKTIAVTDYDALMGTVWVKKIAWRKAKIPKATHDKLLQSLVDAANSGD